MSSRREFLRAASAAAILSPSLLRGASDPYGPLLPQRVLGKTGEKVTAFGLGGHHVGVAENEKHAEALIECAMECGVRFFDNAVSYGDGLSESYYGRFLTPKYLHEYAYSLPIACLLSGCETVQQIKENTAILRSFTGMDEERRKQLVAAVEKIAGPDLETYKRRI